jgi:fumarate hydratase class I
MIMLNPGDSVVDWVLKTVPTMGAGWCPPGMLGIGIGGTAEKAVLMAKESLMDDLDMYELQAKAASGVELSNVEKLRLELFEKVNALGIGAQGLGGLTTVLDVKIKMSPTHAASNPQLRRHPSRPFCNGRQRPGVPSPTIARPVAQRQLDT